MMPLVFGVPAQPPGRYAGPRRLRAHTAPVPGSAIALCPEKTTKSTSRSAVDSGRCPTLCAASRQITTSGPAAARIRCTFMSPP
jgi:hypothetical protein